MNKFFSFAAMAIFGLSAFTGCKKSSGSSSSVGGTMTATVGGAAFSSSYCYESSAGTAYYTIYGLSGTSMSGAAYITLSIKSSNLTTGAYALDSTGANNIAIYTTSAGAVKKSKTGSVSVTAINAGVNVTGTFSFTCTDGTTVTGGTFDAKF